MSYANYRSAVLRDSPTAFYPLGLVQPGAAGLYRDESPRRLAGDLANYEGTNGSGSLTPRDPMPGAPSPWVATGADSMATAGAANLNTTDLTMEAWLYLVSTHADGADVYPFGLSNPSDPNAWTGIRAYAGNWEAFICNTVGGPFDISRIPILKGRWVHACVTYQGATRLLRFSVNGVENAIQGTGSGSRQPVSARPFVGRYNPTYQLRWPAGSGVLCLAYYDRFDPTMAGRHYRAARGRPPRRFP